jgi:hypothetical protein
MKNDVRKRGVYVGALKKEAYDEYILDLSNKEVDDQKKWIAFLSINIGYEFRDSKGCIRGKCELFNLMKENPESLLHLCGNTHSEYERVDKANYKDGDYIGLLEGATRAKRYILIPEQKPYSQYDRYLKKK